MRVFRNIFCTDMKRAVCSKSFLLTVFLMLMVEMLSVGQMMKVLQYSVIEMVDNVFAGTGSSVILLMLCPLLPFALSYAREEEEKAVTFWMARINTRIYMTSRYWTACVSAFLSVVASFSLLIVVFWSIGHELYDPGLWYDIYGYQQLLKTGKPIAYVIMYLMDRGLSAAMMGGCAVCFSSFYPNQYLTFVGPVCLYFLVLRIFPYFNVEKSYLFVSSWIEGTYASPSGGVISLLCKAGVAFLVCTVYYLISVYFVNRRWHYA